MVDGRHVGNIFEMPQLAYQWTDWDATWVVTSHRAPDMSAMMRCPWQRPLPTNGALNILQLCTSGGRMREPISMKFGTQQHVRASMIVTWSNINFFSFKRADDRHVGKYCKYHNSPSNGPIGTKLGWSHPIRFPTCPPKWGCHGNGHCLATGLAMALWTFSSYGRLEAERVNQFFMTFNIQQQIRTTVTVVIKY